MPERKPEAWESGATGKLAGRPPVRSFAAGLSSFTAARVGPTRRLGMVTDSEQQPPKARNRRRRVEQKWPPVLVLSLLLQDTGGTRSCKTAPGAGKVTRGRLRGSAQPPPSARPTPTVPGCAVPVH